MTNPKKLDSLPDRPTNLRESIHVDKVLTEREYISEKVRWYLTTMTLPLYAALLTVTLLAGIMTGKDIYLACFDNILKFMTPEVATIYTYYFLSDRLKRKPTR